jgi:hypothetical protein
MKQGVMATINQSLDADTAGTIALEYGIELRITQRATPGRPVRERNHPARRAKRRTWFRARRW